MKKFKANDIFTQSFVYDCETYYLIVLGKETDKNGNSVYDCLLLDWEMLPVFRKNIKSDKSLLVDCCKSMLSHMFDVIPW